LLKAATRLWFPSVAAIVRSSLESRSSKAARCARSRANAQETKDGWPRLTARIKVPEQKTTVTAFDKLERRWKK